MFGGVWNAARAVEEGGITEDQAAGMGQEALAQLVSGIQECVDAGLSTSTDAFADAIALWVGLHGLAHQRTAAPAFPWPPDLAERLTTSLAHL